MISKPQADKIKAAFKKDSLRIKSMRQDGSFSWERILKAHKNPTPVEPIFRITTEDSELVVTGGHRVYLSPNLCVPAEELSVGLSLQTTEGHSKIREISRIEDRPFMFDLTVEENHNLVLTKSRVVVHNCPDRYYHFRPPEHEANIGGYNRVFGQVWEDEEYLEYLERALDWWNMQPPETEELMTLDTLVSLKPAWRTAILQGAIQFAAMALQANWIVDEFDYSIGGISLSLDRSSKYESLKSNAEQMWQQSVEAKARTVKYIRGLRQPKYGIGVRSAFGPHVGRGVLSPRNFL
jgi:hypothetical protein